MCGLFGFSDPLRMLRPAQARVLTNAMARASMERGTDAAGIAYSSAGRLHIFKRPLPADKLNLCPALTAGVVMGHVRMSTQGDARFDDNNHPFPGQFTAGGTDFALAHNGVLYNDRLLTAEHHLPHTRIETDSYVAVQLLEAAGHLDMDTVRQMAGELEGTFTLTILGHEGELYLVRGNNPLAVWYYPRLGLTVYASTEPILKKGVDAIRFLRRQPHELILLKEGEILLLHADGEQERCQFQLHPGCYSRFGMWNDWALYGDLPRKRRRQRAQLLDDLLSTAANLGYERSDIQLLLDYGFSGDEIEQMLEEPELLRSSVQEAAYYIYSMV